MGCTHGANCRLSMDGKDYGFARFVPHGVVKQLTDGSLNTIRGYLELSANRRTEGILTANFSVMLEMTWEEMTCLLDDVLPFDVASGVYTIAENAPAIPVLVDYDHTIHKFTNAKCGAFELMGQKGTSPCQIMLHFFAENWEVDQAWVGAAITEDVPYAFHNAALNLQDITGASFDRFKLSVDLHMFVEHNNSVTPTDICPRYTEVLFATSAPYDDPHSDLLHYWLQSYLGADAVLQFTAGVRETTFTLGYLQRIAQGIPIPGKVNIRDGLFYRAGRFVDPVSTAVTPSLTVEHTTTGA